MQRIEHVSSSSSARACRRGDSHRRRSGPRPRGIVRATGRVVPGTSPQTVRPQTAVRARTRRQCCRWLRATISLPIACARCVLPYPVSPDSTSGLYRGPGDATTASAAATAASRFDVETRTSRARTPATVPQAATIPTARVQQGLPPMRSDPDPGIPRGRRVPGRRRRAHLERRQSLDRADELAMSPSTSAGALAAPARARGSQCG